MNKTVSGLLKLLFPDPEMPIPDEELEAVVRIALEARRRVKEQQKRCLKTEFRNTHFSYFMGVDGVEQFVSTPELHSDEAIEADPLPPGQVWAISPGGQEAAPSLYRIEATSGPGGGVKILNAPVPPAFRESVRYGEQNLYSQAKELVGDRDPRSHEFSVQLRAMDTDRSGHGLGLPVLAGAVRKPDGAKHQGRPDRCRLAQPGRLGGDDPQSGGRRRVGGREGRSPASHADFVATATSRPAGRNGDQGEHRVLRRPGRCIHEGDSGIIGMSEAA